MLKPTRTLAEVLAELDRSERLPASKRSARLEAGRRLLVQLHKACDDHDCCGLGYTYVLDSEGLHILRRDRRLASWVAMRNGTIAFVIKAELRISPEEFTDIDSAVLRTAVFIRDDAANPAATD